MPACGDVVVTGLDLTREQIEEIRERLKPEWPAADGPVIDTLCDMALRLAAAERELEHFRTSGIVEIAVRNVNVRSYIDHWEGRTEKAEARVAALEAALRKIAEAYADGDEIDAMHFQRIAREALAPPTLKDPT